jgi:hypothetical protein
MFLKRRTEPDNFYLESTISKTLLTANRSSLLNPYFFKTVIEIVHQQISNPLDFNVPDLLKLAGIYEIVDEGY